MFNVLIVDDEKYIRKSIRLRINWEDLKCKVIAEADNGQTAYEIFQNHHIDIMIADIRMPKLGGLDLIEKVKLLNPNLQVIIISGHDNFKYTKEAIKLKVIDYIKKPIDTEELRQTLETATKSLEQKLKSIEDYSSVIEKATQYTDVISSRQINNLCENPDVPKNLLETKPNSKYTFILIYFSNLDSIPKKLDKATWKNLKSSIDEIFRKYADKDFSYHITYNELLINETRILLSTKKQSIKSIVDNLFLELQDRYDTTFKKINIASTFNLDEYKNLHTQYSSALYLLKSKILFNKSCVINTENLTDIKKEDIILTMITRFKTLIHSKQLRKAENLLEKMFLNESYLDVQTIEAITTSIYSLAMEYSTRYNIDRNLFMAYKLTGRYTLLFYDSIQQLLNTLNSFIFSVFSQEPYLSNIDMIKSIKQYIDCNLSNDLNATIIADTFFINSSYLSSLFKKKTNINLCKYIEKERIKKACMLLADFDISITEVAIEVGYNDANYFTKVFKKNMGITPTEYIKNRIL